MARPQQTDDFHFEGFLNPTTTPVPDVVFDRLLGRLKEAELKALLYIIRRTFGFKRDRDSISFNQFLRGITTREGRVLDEGCGVRDRTTLSNALKSLEKKGIVISEKGMDERGENQTTVYALRFKQGDTASENAGEAEVPEGVVGNSHYPSRNYPPPVVGNSYPQQTGKQQTEVSHSNIRMSTRSNDVVVDNSAAHRITPMRTAAAFPDRRGAAPGVEHVGAIMARTGVQAAVDPTPKPARGRPRTFADTESQTILAYVKDFAREFGDGATLSQSATRVVNLYRKWGREDLNAFIALVYEARAVTKAQGHIRGSKFAYFCGVLEDRLGLRGDDAATSGPA